MSPSASIAELTTREKNRALGVEPSRAPADIPRGQVCNACGGEGSATIRGDAALVSVLNLLQFNMQTIAEVAAMSLAGGQ